MKKKQIVYLPRQRCSLQGPTVTWEEGTPEKVINDNDNDCKLMSKQYKWAMVKMFKQWYAKPIQYIIKECTY